MHFLRMQIFAIIRVRSRQLIYPDECYAIRGAVYEVYRELGSGFREEVYQQCLEREFAARGIPFDSKKELRIFYKGAPIEKTYVPDFYCYGKIIVEIKAVESLTKEHRSQLMNYLRLTSSKLGLLVNFGAYPKAVVEQWANCFLRGCRFSCTAKAVFVSRASDADRRSRRRVDDWRRSHRKVIHIKLKKINCDLQATASTRRLKRR